MLMIVIQKNNILRNSKYRCVFVIIIFQEDGDGMDVVDSRVMFYGVCDIL